MGIIRTRSDMVANLEPAPAAYGVSVWKAIGKARRKGVVGRQLTDMLAKLRESRGNKLDFEDAEMFS